MQDILDGDFPDKNLPLEDKGDKQSACMGCAAAVAEAAVLALPDLQVRPNTGKLQSALLILSCILELSAYLFLRKGKRSAELKGYIHFQCRRTQVDFVTRFHVSI